MKALYYVISMFLQSAKSMLYKNREKSFNQMTSHDFLLFYLSLMR